MLMQTLHLANHSCFCLRLQGNGRRTSPWTSPHLIRLACQAEWTKSSWAGQQDKGERNQAEFGQMNAPHSGVARFTHPKTNLAWCRENSPRASSPRWDKSHRTQLLHLLSQYHNSADFKTWWRNYRCFRSWRGILPSRFFVFFREGLLAQEAHHV